MSDQNDDKSLFRALFGGIKRTKSERTPEWRRKPRITPGHRSHAAAISARPELDTASHSNGNTYRAGGVQHGVLKKLRRGRPKPRTSIDLHGMTRETALRELQNLIHGCQSRGINCVHVIHGKGHQSADGKAVLKPSVAIRLGQMPEVLAYCPAQAKDGGDGALYVLLKKSLTASR